MADQRERPIFDTLKEEVANLHMYWTIYEQLFGGTEQTVELLNETGPTVFYVLQHLLLDEATLSICRLTDPAKTGHFENHSLAQLAADLDTSEELRGELRGHIHELQDKVKPFRDRRNKAIAHSDLLTRQQLVSNPLPGITREMVSSVLLDIVEIMNRYEHAIARSITAYDMVILPLGSDGRFLIEQLKRSVAFRDMERRREVSRELWTEGRYRDA